MTIQKIITYALVSTSSKVQGPRSARWEHVPQFMPPCVGVDLGVGDDVDTFLVESAIPSS